MWELTRSCKISIIFTFLNCDNAVSVNFRLLPFRWERTFSMLLKFRKTSLFIGRERFECSNKFKCPEKRGCLCIVGVEVSN